MKESTTVPGREADLTREKWYYDVQDVFQCGEVRNRNDVRTDNTTFLQVFFGFAVSCGTYVLCKNIHEFVKETDNPENEFYENIKKDISIWRDKILKTETVQQLLDNLRLDVEKIISDTFKKEFDTDYTTRQGEYRGLEKFTANGAEMYRYRGIVQTYTYQRDREKIYDHYYRHKDFYLYYLAGVLMLMNKSGLEDIDQIRKNICDTLKKKLSYIPIAEGMTDTLQITAYYLYCLTLVSIKREDFIKKSSESGHLAGLTDKGDINIRLQRDDYIAVTEYYPVNTVERLGALEKLSEMDNIYAMQELYFLYQHDTVMYNASGEKRLCLTRAPERAADIYDRLAGERSARNLPLFRKDRNNSTQINSPLLRLEECRRRYDSGERGNFLKDMTEALKNIFHQKEVPFNIELVLFLKRVLDENEDELKNEGELKEELRRELDGFPLTVEFSLPDDDGIDLLDVLVRFYESKAPEDLLMQICRAYSDNERLRIYRRLASDKADRYFELYVNSRNPNGSSQERYDPELTEHFRYIWELWSGILQIMRRAAIEP